MASTYLTYTPSSTGSTTKATLSVWAKRANIGAEGFVFYAKNDSSYQTRLNFQPADTLYMNNVHGGSNDGVLTTNAVYRDPSAFYHIVASWDTTQATASNRFKLWVNGVQQTFTGSSYPAQDRNMRFNESGSTMYIGNQVSANYFEGIYSHFHWIDGTAYQASDFGETDSTTGEWKIKTSPSVTYGTNGAFILKDGNSVTDQSGQGNNWSVAGGTLTKTEDNPSNVFATLNPLNVATSDAPTFTNGNTTTESATTSGQRFMGSSTIGASTGKYYAECRIKVVDSTSAGVSPDVSTHAKDNTFIGSHAHDWAILFGSGNKYNNDSGTTHGDAFSVDDILMIAMDLDNNNVYFGRNGNWFDGSGNANQSSPNSALSLTARASTPDGFYFFGCSDGGGSAKGKCEWNFGNGYFGTTQISSEGTNASGIGKFEFNVPAGYTALSTKGLNE